MAESTGILLCDAEDNDLTPFTVVEEGGNEVSIVAGAAAHGSLGYRFTFDGQAGDNNCYFYEDFTSGSDIYIRQYFKFSSDFDADALGYFSMLTHYYDSGNYCLYVRAVHNGTTFLLNRVYYITNAGVQSINLTATAITLDTLHYIEGRYKSGNGDGAVEVWYDGTLIASAYNLTNDNYETSYVFVGNLQSLVPVAGCYVDIDDAKVDSSYIGAYADVGGTVYPKICISEDWKDISAMYICISEVWKEITELNICISESWKDLV